MEVVLISSNGPASRVQFPVASVITVTQTWERVNDSIQASIKCKGGNGRWQCLQYTTLPHSSVNINQFAFRNHQGRKCIIFQIVNCNISEYRSRDIHVIVIFHYLVIQSGNKTSVSMTTSWFRKSCV